MVTMILIELQHFEHNSLVPCCYLLQEPRLQGHESLQPAEVMSDLQPFGNAPPLALANQQGTKMQEDMDLRNIMRHVYNIYIYI